MSNIYQYRIQVIVSPAELARFQSAFAETQQQMSELVLKAEQRNGFPMANEVINRIRGM
jgi:hypothetical protein